MKRFILYIMLCLLIGESTSFIELVKLPWLYSHYKEHVERDPKVSVVDYLAMHYWGQDIDDNDDEKDMQLPFKKHDIIGPVFLFVPAQKISLSIPHSWFVEQSVSIAKADLFFSRTGDSLFRPPRV